MLENTHRAMSMLLFALLLSGCVNIERQRFESEWGARSDITDLRELKGLYRNRAREVSTPREPIEHLWFYLTRVKYEHDEGQYVRISVTPDNMLVVDLLNVRKELVKNTTMYDGTDFSRKDGYLQLRHHSDASADALGSGVGTGSCKLFLVADKGLAGEMDGVAAGLAFHILPAIGFANTWLYWQRLDIGEPDATTTVP